MWPLVDVLVGRERDHEHIAERLGLLEVAEVADVEQVEDAVAVNDLPPLAAESGESGGEFGEGLDLVAGRHAVRVVASSSKSRRPPALYPSRRRH